MGRPSRVVVQPGAGLVYEDRFSFYWLTVAWSVFCFNVLAMLVVIFAMSSSSNMQYQWLPHLAGTAIVDCGIAFMAVVYRFVLFPPPGYQIQGERQYYYTPTPEVMPSAGVAAGVPNGRTTSPFPAGEPGPHPQPQQGPQVQPQAGPRLAATS